MKLLSILAVGMLPPPISGQAIAFERTIRALERYYDVTVINIQLQRNTGEAGLFSWRKLTTVLKLFTRRMIPLLFRKKFDVLYYCPTGPSTFGVIKDLLFLSVLRASARKTVYHFHATGGVAFILRKNALIRAVARLVMFDPDLALRCADVEPNDADLCHAKKDLIVFNGIDDPAPLVPAPVSVWPEGQLSLIFVGTLIEEKGVFDLIEVARLLRERGQPFLLHIVGEGTPVEVRRLDDLISFHNLSDSVKRTGILLGQQKFRLLKAATIFLFPTYYRAETQPIAAIEALSLGVPVIASDWRGLNTIVDDGVNGYLVPPRDPIAFCHAIERILLENKIERMRKEARRIFLERFSVERFFENILIAFRSLELEHPSDC